MLWLVALLIQRLLGYLMWPGCLVNTDFPHTHTHTHKRGKRSRIHLQSPSGEAEQRLQGGINPTVVWEIEASSINRYVCIENKALDCFSRIREGRFEMEMKSLTSVAWGLYAHLVQLNSFQWCNCKIRIDDKTFWWHNSAANTGHVTLEIRGNMIP